jgi:hypothetical protein
MKPLNPRRWLACIALVVVPACLDPIVGTECAAGYSPCQGVCVTTGTCAALDAASAAPGEVGTAIDAGVDGDDTDASESLDAMVPEGGAEAGTLDDALGGEPADGKGSEDVPVQDDVLTLDDAPLLDDTGPPPILAVDAAQGEAIDAEATIDGLPCAGCVDAEGAESGNADDGGASASDATSDDATIDDADNSATVDSALVCADPQVICNEQCVDLSLDPENCGDCNNLCASGVCNDSGCLICAAEESVCGRQCANLATDPDNCGSCGIPCGSGLCSNGQCEAAGTGHAIVIGHDYLKNRPAMNRILGNAVFLWPVNPVRLLVYEGNANPVAIAGADAAIAQVAGATGRRSVRVAAAAADVPTLLATTDVFLIYGQELADDPTLSQLGLDWASALFTFVNAGGTLVLLDGVYPGNSGTCQILAQAGLFQVARNITATGDVCTVAARGDALATGLPRTYLCEQNSTSFAVTDPSNNITTVVQDVDRTVVVHKLF